MEYLKWIELPFKVIASWEPKEPDVGYPGGVYIDDVTLDGVSVFTGNVQDKLEQRMRDLEPEMMEEVEEEMHKQAQDDAAAKADWEYEMMKDRRIFDHEERCRERYMEEKTKRDEGARPCNSTTPF